MRLLKPAASEAPRWTVGSARPLSSAQAHADRPGCTTLRRSGGRQRRVGHPTTRSILVPAVSVRQELALRFLVLTTVAAGAWFWLWWLATGHGSWTSPLSAVSTVLLAWVFLMPTYFLFFACRMTRPNFRIPLPDLRVAMIVTKAPSEPWAVVRTTLEAMVAQDHPSPTTSGWPTATDHQDPHRCARTPCTSPPFRRRGLPAPDMAAPAKSRRATSHFYDTVGYRDYDVVVQLDCDHVPNSAYLTAMVRPFAARRSGIPARRASATPTPTWDGRSAVACIVRRRCTDHAGGRQRRLCPRVHRLPLRRADCCAAQRRGPRARAGGGLQHDLWLQSGGWTACSGSTPRHTGRPGQRRRALDPGDPMGPQPGDAPDQVAAGPSARRAVAGAGADGVLALLLLVMGVMLTVATLFPVTGVLLRQSWGHTSLVDFYADMWAYSLLLLGAAIYVRHLHVFRPRDELWSWEAILFQLVRWPWTFGVSCRAVFGGAPVRGVQSDPEGRQEESLLRARSLLPMFALGAAPAWVVVFTPPRDLVLGPHSCASRVRHILPGDARDHRAALAHKFRPAGVRWGRAARQRRHSVTLGITICSPRPW